MATGRQIGHPLRGHISWVTSVVFSSDGKTLASGAGDGTVRLWDVATHQQIRRPLAGPNARIQVISVAFSRDGKALASATSRQIGSPLTSTGWWVFSVAFSRDGKTLASNSGDGTVRLWNVAYLAENIVRRLCASAGRPLTRAEWARYVPSGPAYHGVSLNANIGFPDMNVPPRP